MPIYSETLKDEDILRILGNRYQNVLVIGCGACMNESLAYRYSLPIFKGSPDIPYATVLELCRVEKLLADNGYKVETKYYNDINGFYCMTDIAVDSYPTDWTIKQNVILILSCNSGCEGLRLRLPNANIVRITKLIGGIPYEYLDKGDQRIIIKTESTIIPLTKEDSYAKV